MIWHLSQMTYKSSGRSMRKMLPPPNGIIGHQRKAVVVVYNHSVSRCPGTSFHSHYKVVPFFLLPPGPACFPVTRAGWLSPPTPQVPLTTWPLRPSIRIR